MYYKRSQLDALIERLRARRRFITPTGLVVYVAGVLLLLVILYPGEQVSSIIRDTQVHDAFSVKYFENQLAAQPGDMMVRRAVSRIYMRGQDIEKLQQVLPPLLKSGDEQQKREAAFFDVFVFLFSAQDRYRDAPDELRRETLERIKRIGPLQGLTTHRELMFYGDQALGRSMLVSAAQIYLLSMDLASDETMRRRAFLQAVSSMEQTGNPQVALQLAERYVPMVSLDLKTAWYMMNLARKAGQIPLARKYALIMLNMEKHEPN